MGKEFQMPYEVVYYDTDLTGKMTLERLIAVAVLVSEKQSAALKRDANYLKAFGLGWVITQYEIEIKSLPKLFDTLTFYTKATTWNKFFCYRKFWGVNEAGETQFEIDATFVLMDLTTRKIKGVTEEIIAPFGGEKVNQIRRGEKLKKVTYPKGENYRVRYFDLDVNQHVNNSKYFTWLLDPLDEKFLQHHEPEKIFVRFDKEVGLREVVESSFVYESDSKTSYHQIRNGEALCTEGKIIWKNC